jgi:hypothetical protein
MPFQKRVFPEQPKFTIGEANLAFDYMCMFSQAVRIRPVYQCIGTERCLPSNRAVNMPGRDEPSVSS